MATKPTTRRTASPTPMPMNSVVFDFGAAARADGRAALGRDRVVGRPPRPVEGTCFGTPPVAALPVEVGAALAGALTAGWPSRVEPRPGRCVAIFRSFPLA